MTTDLESRKTNRLHKWSRTSRGILIATAAIVCWISILAAAEMATRVRHRMKFGNMWGIEDTYTVAPDSGLKIPVPNGSWGGIRINSLGFRGPDLAVPKPKATLRIAFLGGSVTYCADVSSNDRTWPALVAKAVQTRWPEIAVDYVNGGVPGYSAVTSLRNLESRVASLQPDIIIINEGHNDLSGNSFDLAVRQGLVSKHTEQSMSWPSKYSLLWYLLEKNLVVTAQRNAAEEVTGKLVFDRSELTAPFRRDLTDLVNASKREAAMVVLVTMSTELRRDQSSERQAAAAANSLFYMPYMSIQGLLDGYSGYNDVIREVARDSGVLLVGGEDSIPGNPEYFVDSVHFTDRGSEAMANRIAAVLLESKGIKEILCEKSEIVAATRTGASATSCDLRANQ